MTENRQTADDFEKSVKENPHFSPLEIANSVINKRPLVTKSSTPIDEKKLDETIQKVLSENPKAVADYKSGKTQVLGFLIGQVAKTDPAIDKNIIKKYLGQKLS